MARKRTPPPLWSCPNCGAQFASANMWHSCGRFDLDALFARSEPVVRRSFDRFKQMVEACGPVIMIPQKTRLVFMVRMRFANVVVQKSTLRIGLVLRKRVTHACLTKIEDYGPNSILNLFQIASPEQLDAAMQRLVRDAYVRGTQKHLFVAEK